MFPRKFIENARTLITFIEKHDAKSTTEDAYRITEAIKFQSILNCALKIDYRLNWSLLCPVVDWFLRIDRIFSLFSFEPNRLARATLHM